MGEERNNGYSFNLDDEILISQPKMKEVVILNDDYTSMSFVTMLLVNVFDKTVSDANSIMMKVHNEGEGVCGVYPYDIAELKFSLANTMITNNREPLRLIMRDV